MAKNQRQRRPLQDDTRTGKRTVRERAQISKRQRERIEENRDRREQRRERQRERRKTVDSIRSPKEDLRTYRTEARLIPVEDTFLGQPVGVPDALPVVIGESWVLASNQTIQTSTTTTVLFDTDKFTTERNGYPRLYTTSTGNWRIPSGLSGIWFISAAILWPNTSNPTYLYVELNGTTNIAEIESGDPTDFTQTISVVYNFQEADEFAIRVRQITGGPVAVQAKNDVNTWAFAHFLGK